MAPFESRRFVFGLALVLALPGMAAAQSSTFIIDFNRTGLPGTEVVTQIDPLNPSQTITTTVATGAFVNPCTSQNVDVIGTSTISTVQSIDKFGQLKVSVSEVTKGTGTGWIGADYATRTLTGATYAFNENSQFTFRLPAAGAEFTSDFTDKLAMKGAKSIDNWVIRATFRIKVNADGTVQVFMIKMNADNCKG